MVQMTQDPILLKPGNMPNFPTQRIDDTQARPDRLLLIQIRNQRECALSCFVEQFSKSE